MLKSFLTSASLEAGLQGGEVPSLFEIGSSLGSVIGQFVGISPSFIEALRMITVFRCTTNSPWLLFSRNRVTWYGWLTILYPCHTSELLCKRTQGYLFFSTNCTSKATIFTLCHRKAMARPIMRMQLWVSCSMKVFRPRSPSDDKCNYYWHTFSVKRNIIKKIVD